MKVYEKIAAVQGQISKVGISKGRKNAQQGYSFRGIDDVYSALAPLLSENGLCILPRILSRSCIERTTAKGGLLFYVIVDAEFDLVAAEDGSKHTIRTIGEAMDSADKATNKAMSAAYKYACLQAFCIPTEGDNDADATTHEPLRFAQDAQPPSAPRQAATAPRISAEQSAHIQTLLMDSGIVEDGERLKKFCARYLGGSSDVSRMFLSDYKPAVAALEKVAAAKGGAS